jgi:hypothetical protein
LHLRIYIKKVFVSSFHPHSSSPLRPLLPLLFLFSDHPLDVSVRFHHEKVSRPKRFGAGKTENIGNSLVRLKEPLFYTPQTESVNRYPKYFEF